MKLPLFILGAFVVLIATSVWVADVLVTSAEDRASLAAVFINDSSVVEFTGTTENPAPIGSSQVNLNNQGSFLPQASTPNDEPVLPNVPPLQNGDVPPVIETVIVTTSNPAPTPGQVTDVPPTSTTVIPVDEVFTALIGSGAITGLPFGDVAGSGGVLGLGELRFFGDAIRETLRAQRITQLAIPNRAALLAQTQVPFSRSDFALFVASATLDDPNIEEVSFFNGTLKTRYRALGRIFGFIPVRYSLQVESTFQESTLADVRLRFPWYSFVLAKGISSRALEARIENSIRTETSGFTTEYDLATRAFVGVSDTLRLQFGDF